ncbi:MAG TPA: hypothetical protein VGR47_05840 [Terracidiphilus sp.]|nr:hypothetical protein [Terracidiphilus sp.]
MIQQALEFLAKLQTPRNPVTVEVAGTHYAVKSDGTLGDAVRPVNLAWPRAPLELSTLSGLVEAFRVKAGGLRDRVALQIASHLEVRVVDLDLDERGQRRVYAAARHAPDTRFRFDTFMDPEEFLLAFRASFYFNGEAVKVQQLCSTVGAGNAVTVADDGISQEVVVKSGTVTKVPVTLPSDGVPLIPWRTFRDANPVESRFLLRMHGVKDGLPQIALFEIDAKWKLDTIGSIRNYLASELPDATIIA